MTAFLITLYLFPGILIQERPMRSMERCEAVAKAYSENVNSRGRKYYCISVDKGWSP